MESEEVEGITDEGPLTEVKALHALAKNGLTHTAICRQDLLLKLVSDAFVGCELTRLQRVKILYGAFEEVARSARSEVLRLSASGVPETDTSLSERRSIAAAGELLGLTDISQFKTRLGRAGALYEQRVSARRSAWHVRKVRASVWIGGMFYPEATDRHAAKAWWPTFIQAVESHLEAQAVRYLGRTDEGKAHEEQREIIQCALQFFRVYSVAITVKGVADKRRYDRIYSQRPSWRQRIKSRVKDYR